MPRAGLTREKVIEKAAELADERGIDGVTITTLAEYLGIRKPSLYNHIEGPEDVRTQIMLYGWRYLSRQAVEEIRTEEPYEALKEYARQVYRYAQEHPGVFEAMLWYNTYENEEFREVTEGLYRFFFAQTDKLRIDREAANHLLRTYRAFVEGFLLLVIHDSFGNPLSVKESFELSLEVLVSGMKPYENKA